jgi:hypothetical protein
MRYSEIHENATRSLLRLPEGALQQTMPIPYLYHATSQKNLPAIQRDGLLTRFYGTIHGGMDTHPPKPAIYLARGIKSNNLNTELFKHGPIVVLKIDAQHLNVDEIYPDDAIYDLVTEGEIFNTARSIATALGCPLPHAHAILEQIENGDETTFPLILKPFWRWYLQWRRGGEIAYTADIPPALIVATAMR